MTVPLLRSHIVDVLDKVNTTWNKNLADVLLADPTLAAIIDLAANAGAPRDDPWKPAHRGPSSPEVRALLANWRATGGTQ